MSRTVKPSSFGVRGSDCFPVRGQLLRCGCRVVGEVVAGDEADLSFFIPVGVVTLPVPLSPSPRLGLWACLNYIVGLCSVLPAVYWLAGSCLRRFGCFLDVSCFFGCCPEVAGGVAEAVVPGALVVVV